MNRNKRNYGSNTQEWAVSGVREAAGMPSSVFSPSTVASEQLAQMANASRKTQSQQNAYNNSAGQRRLREMTPMQRAQYADQVVTANEANLELNPDMANRINVKNRLGGSIDETYNTDRKFYSDEANTIFKEAKSSFDKELAELQTTANKEGWSIDDLSDAVNSFDSVRKYGPLIENHASGRLREFMTPELQAQFKANDDNLDSFVNWVKQDFPDTPVEDIAEMFDNNPAMRTAWENDYNAPKFDVRNGEVVERELTGEQQIQSEFEASNRAEELEINKRRQRYQQAVDDGLINPNDYEWDFQKQDYVKKAEKKQTAYEQYEERAKLYPEFAKGTRFNFLTDRVEEVPAPGYLDGTGTAQFNTFTDTQKAQIADSILRLEEKARAGIRDMERPEVSPEMMMEQAQRERDRYGLTGIDLRTGKKIPTREDLIKRAKQTIEDPNVPESTKAKAREALAQQEQSQSTSADSAAKKPEAKPQGTETQEWREERRARVANDVRRKARPSNYHKLEQSELEQVVKDAQDPEQALKQIDDEIKRVSSDNPTFRWKSKNVELKSLQESKENYMELLDMVNDIAANNETEEMAKQRHDQEIERLKERYNSGDTGGAFSGTLQAQIDRLKKKQAKEQAIIKALNV